MRLEVSRVANSTAGTAAPERGLFDGLDSSWARFKDVRLADSVRAAVDSLPVVERLVRQALDLNDPSQSGGAARALRARCFASHVGRHVHDTHVH